MATEHAEPSAATNAEPDQSEILTVDQIERRYPDEWVVIAITRDHREHGNVRGRLLAHSPDRDALVDVSKAFWQVHPDQRLYTFFTGNVIPEDVVVVL